MNTIKLKRILHRICPVLMTKYYYKKIIGRRLDLDNPKSLNEKVNWLKLYYWPKQKISSVLADKYGVRQYVIDKGCASILNTLIGAWESVDAIPWDSLPSQFAIKCGHGCGMNIVCFNKSSINKADVFSKLNTWLKTDWGLYSC